jgi:predicted RNase H-like HicB family nuclease
MILEYLNWRGLITMTIAAMSQNPRFTAIIEREGDGYVALCPELDIASQGNSIEEAKCNLKEAIELFLEVADPLEVESRRNNDHSLSAKS